MKDSVDIYECEFCTKKTTTKNLPNNWIEVTLQDTFLDRSFIEKHLCGECVIKILKARSLSIARTEIRKAYDKGKAYEKGGGE